MRLIFCGTPRFAVPTLRKLVAAGHTISLAVTQPSRPSGRAGEILEPPVKLLAKEFGIEVQQPERIKNNPEFAALLRSIRPDAIIVVAYGRIIPQWMLDLPPLGNINLHASLLPKYRGAAPIQWAIARGETVTGATTMRLDAGLDTGPVLLQSEVVISPDQTAADLAPLLAEAGAGLVATTLERLDPAAVNPVEPAGQDDGKASLAPILKREDAMIDFGRTAREIYNRWRGFQPWPGAYTFLGGRKLIFHRLKPAERTVRDSAPGEVAIEDGRIFAAAGDGRWIEIFELQAEGRKRLAAPEFLHGAPNLHGARLGR